MQIPFEVTFDADDLDVAAKIYDVTDGSPALVSTVAMEVVAAGLHTYWGRYDFDESKQYIIVKSAYTDGTFTTLHPDYNSGSDSVVDLTESE